MMDTAWVCTGLMVKLAQEPDAPEIADDVLDHWLGTATVEAIVEAPPWPLEAAAMVIRVPESDRICAEMLAARQHAIGVPGREVGDHVSVWRHLMVLLAVPPGATTSIDQLVITALQATRALAPPAPWRAHLDAATSPLSEEALRRFDGLDGWIFSSGLSEP